MDELHQAKGYGIDSVPKAIPPVIHSEPNDLYEEISNRLEHYNSQIDKLEQQLRKVTLMRDVLAAAQNAFDRETNNVDLVTG